MKRPCLILLPVLALVLAACGSSSSSSTSSASSSSTPAASTPSTPASTSSTSAATTPAKTAGGTVTVTMQNIAFNPASVNVKVGQTVKWINHDSAPHNVTPVSGPTFSASPTFQSGGTFSLNLTKAGTIKYQCTIHPGMTGTLIVAP